MDRLQSAVAGLDRFAQCGDRGNCSAGIAYIVRQTLHNPPEGLLCVTLQSYRTGVEIVEFARINIHPQQLGVERQAFTPVVGVGHFGTHCQHHVGFGAQVPARFYAQG
ncbi:hypothetical protein D9M71_526110 [compost metagenome]